MKIYIRIILISITVTILSSCNDILDKAPDGKLTYEEIFGDNDKTGAYLNSCYSHLKEHGVKYFYFSRGPAVWSDEAWDGDDIDLGSEASARLYNGSASAESHPITNARGTDAGGTIPFDANFWSDYFTGIRKCSFFLAHIDDANVDKETDRARWRAEAHLLRAYYYHELLRWYGTGLPIFREALAWNADFSEVKKSSYGEVVDFIIEDCDFALNETELPWRITETVENGRFTKAVAEAIKSRIIIFLASPLYNEGGNHWQKAYEITKKSVENLKDNGYALYSKVNFPQTYQAQNAHLPNQYAALYNEYFTQEKNIYSSTSVDKETIYQARTHGGYWYGNPWSVDGVGPQDGYKSGTCPSQELVDAYETSDGQPILDLLKPYKDEKHADPNYNAANTLYNPANPYENRDPRFYASIYYNGSARTAWWGFREPIESLENYPAEVGYRKRIIATWIGEPQTGISETSRSKTRTGYYHRKFLHPNSGTSLTVAALPFKFFRLGEMILNYAEAAAEAGHVNEAISATNEIRARVGMPPLPSSLSKEEAITRIRNERRVELAFEEHRYFDVRRWTKPDGDLSQTDRWITAMAITRHANGSFSYKRQPVRIEDRKCYTNKFLKLPIPMRDVTIVKEKTGENWQNPGW